MSTFDIIIIVFLILGAFKGYKQGLIVEVFSFIAFFLGLFLALEFTIPISMNLFESTSFFDVGAIIVFIALFILLSILIKAAAKAIKKMVDFTFLGTLDNILGSVAGLFKSAFIISVILWVFSSVGFDIVNRYVDDTMVLQYIVPLGPVVFEWASSVIPYVKDLIDTMENLPNGGDSLLTYLFD